tara:strand:- start:471 stop:929 length:459 start_codon:yes stop_codon:yes gene_type:complete
MRAREFIREFGPVGAIGSAARGAGVAAGAAMGMAKNFGKAFVKSASSGKVDLDNKGSLGSALADALGLDQTADNIRQNSAANTEVGQSSDIGQAPVDKQAAARSVQGKDINLPPLGQVRVSRVTPNEIELDTSKTGLGVPKVKLNPRDLQQR